MLNAIYRRHRITVEPAKCEDGNVRLYWTISHKNLGLCANGLKEPGPTEDECIRGLLAHIDHELARNTPWSEEFADRWSQEKQAAA